jgi:hypothetical protein
MVVSPGYGKTEAGRASFGPKSVVSCCNKMNLYRWAADRDIDHGPDYGGMANNHQHTPHVCYTNLIMPEKRIPHADISSSNRIVIDPFAGGILAFTERPATFLPFPDD